MEEKEKDGKKMLIALIIIILLLLAALVWFLFFFKWPKKAEPVTNQQSTEQPVQQLDTVDDTIATSVKQLEIVADKDAQAPDQKDVEMTNLEKLASLFAERLGSYSNQSEYGNLVDLKVFMTDSMNGWADDYIAKAKAESNYDGVYRGVMTRAISAEVSDLDDSNGTAKAVVHTQKVESSDVSDNVVYYEDLSIGFKKEGPVWLVDDARWLGKKSN